MSIGKTLFPPSNRMAAAVAFFRTVWQVIRPPIALGGIGLGVIASTGSLHIDLKTLGIIAAATALSAIVSGLLAAGDILKNGLPNAYQAAAVASIPAAEVSSIPVVAPRDPGADVYPGPDPALVQQDSAPTTGI